MSFSTSVTENWFFDHTGMDRRHVERLVDRTLHDMDDGELFLEYVQSESIVFDDGRIRNASFDTEQGFGLRSVFGETSGFGHSSLLSEENIARAAETVRAIARNEADSVHFNLTPNTAPVALYGDINPIHEVAFAKKVDLLAAIDAYLRSKDARVKQVSASLAGEWQVVEILRAGGISARDVRPLVRITITVMVEQDGRMESASTSAGGRTPYGQYIAEVNWKAEADEALRRALVKLESKPAPAGEFPVVLGPGWPGVLLHEAVGHGLEGDFNRKGTSVYSGQIGQQVAAKGVTIVDDGTMKERRGSLTIDDEGTPTSRTVLIEDGILKAYMQDRMNARLTGLPLTGNGRRESYADQPIPRMTNTFMLPGDAEPGEMIASVDKGIYAVNFGGGSVDITSGKFVFSASEAYMIENGKVTYPIKGATLIGNGPDIMHKVTAIGNDLELDKGSGTCGKDGQQVPVGVGQPSLLIERMTIGGTEIAA